MVPEFIDVEASSLDGFPIQVAYGSREGEIVSHLIRPFDDWLAHPDRWSRQAYELHGLSIEYLLHSGSDPQDVASRIEDNLWGKTVYSDAADYDHIWLDILFSKVSAVYGAHFVQPYIMEMDELLPASWSPDGRRAVRDRVRSDIQQEGLRVHHADADVLVHIRTWREIQKSLRPGEE